MKPSKLIFSVYSPCFIKFRVVRLCNSCVVMEINLYEGEMFQDYAHFNFKDKQTMSSFVLNTLHFFLHLKYLKF